jgi:hypothetical protein
MKERTATLPCALCGRLLDQRADKNSKPYFVCEPCGTQFFIRGTAGRERLAAILRGAKLPGTKNVNRHDSPGIDDGALLYDLEQVQIYIETFCEDELVIPNEPSVLENAISFPKWSREVCDRVLDKLDRCANRT